MNYKEVNDYELLYMVSDNDDNLEFIIEKYKPFINQKIFKYSNYFRRYGIDEEDLKQELYLMIVDAVNSYDDDSMASFYTYLNVLIERKLINFWRSYFSKRNSVVYNSVSISKLVTDNICVEDLLKSSDRKIEDEIIDRDIIAKMFMFCYCLPIEDAFVFELYINGYQRESISQLLDISYKRVYYLVNKNMKKLNNYLRKEELLMLLHSK